MSISMSTVMSLLRTDAKKLTHTYFLMLKFNENVNGFLPIDAEAWYT